MKIIAKDGTDGFNTIEECLKYEAELDAAERVKKAKEEELKRIQKDRYDEIGKLCGEVVSKIKSYEKDYGKRIILPDYSYDYFWRI